MTETTRPARRSSFPVPWWTIAIVLVAISLWAGYLIGPSYFRDPEYWKTFVFGRCLVLMFSGVILAAILHARGGGVYFIRRIPGLTAIDETVGRATEMGRPITFSLGLGGLEIITLQALAIALHVVRLAIRFGTRVIVTMSNPTVYAVADEAISEAYTVAGRPESFNRDDVRFLSDRQFAYASAMTGLIIRERAASNYMFGKFFAEALILAEAGNLVGAIQVAGTPSITQIPFFIASCDYTIIGDEYYAATAYLTREPILTGSLVGQDRAKMIFLGLILMGIATISFLALEEPARWVFLGVVLLAVVIAAIFAPLGRAKWIAAAVLALTLGAGAYHAPHSKAGSENWSKTLVALFRKAK